MQVLFSVYVFESKAIKRIVTAGLWIPQVFCSYKPLYFLTGHQNVQVIQLDLANLENIRKFATEIQEKFSKNKFLFFHFWWNIWNWNRRSAPLLIQTSLLTGHQNVQVIELDLANLENIQEKFSKMSFQIFCIHLKNCYWEPR